MALFFVQTHFKLTLGLETVIFRFDQFTLDTDRLELQCGDQRIDVEPQVFSVLSHLIRNREHVVSKDALIEAVWDGRAISDSTLNTRINAVRRAVGDSGKDQSVIRTFPRRGFRFVAKVVEEGEVSREGLALGRHGLKCRGRDPKTSIYPASRRSPCSPSKT